MKIKEIKNYRSRNVITFSLKYFNIITSRTMGDALADRGTMSNA
jgi:hypothetical protein